MKELKVYKNEFNHTDEAGFDWYKTEHEEYWSDSICDIEIIHEQWQYCPGCGKRIIFTDEVRDED